MNRSLVAALAVLLLATILATLTNCGENDAARGGSGAGAAGQGTHDQGTGARGAGTQGSGAQGKGSPDRGAPTVIGERVRLLVSGSLDGRLEPCGCAGGQLGGLPRRMAHLLEPGRSYDFLIEGGNLVRGATPIEHEKAITAVLVLFGMSRRYDALAVGPHDLALPADWPPFLTAMQVPVLASDLQSTVGEWPGQAFLERDVRGTPVRLAALTMRLPAANGGENGANAAAGLTLLAPEQAWQRAMQGATPETMRVLLVHDAPDRVRALARTLEPRPDLVVGIDDTHTEPPAGPETDPEIGVPIVHPGIRGRYLLDLTLARTSAGPRVLAYEPVPLRGSDTKPGAGEDPDTKQLLLQHREQVAEQDVLEKMAGTLPAPKGGAYVGSAACKECHREDYEIWELKKHARAWQTLVDAEQDPQRYGWPVTQYPDCVSCHVVGYREQGGFVSASETPHLVNVGCERCHGAGGEHVKAPKEHRMGRVGDGAPSLVCVQCHDFEQSPDFDYQQRWLQIQHGKPANAPGK